MAMAGFWSAFLPVRPPLTQSHTLLVIGLILVAVSGTWLGGCLSRSVADTAAITVAGSTSVQPFIELLAEEYSNRYPGRPAINVQGGGSSAGGQAVLTSVAQIGMLSRPPDKSERELTAIPIAYDALVVVVHLKNPIRSLSSAETQAIFAGTVVNWTQLGSTAGNIHIVSREEGSGTRTAFDELVMGTTEVAARAIVQDSNGAVREIVAQDPNAIGYISLGLVDDRVATVEIDNIKPTMDNCQSGAYPLLRPFLFLISEPADKASQDFISFVLSDSGQELLAKQGLVTAK
jgi:phosphate transport system substrate-binding protein